MAVTLNQNWFLGALSNLIVVVKVNNTVAEEVPALVRSCIVDSVDFGDSKAIMSVDTLSTKDYSATSSLLASNPPTVDEQILSVTDRKFVTVTINRYLMKGAFEAEYSMADAIAVILSMLVKTKNIYTYKKCVKAYRVYVPAKTTQTVTVNLVNISLLTSVVEQASARTQNSNAIYKALMGTFKLLCSPTRKFNDLGFETLMRAQELKLIINDKFENDMTVDTLSTLLNSSKITDEMRWGETISVPQEQFVNDDGTADTTTQNTVIGWLGHNDKYQVSPYFTVGTAFFDGSNLNENNWLHFWLISGMVNGLPAVKIVANYVAPTGLK